MSTLFSKTDPDTNNQPRLSVINAMHVLYNQKHLGLIP